MPPVGGAPGRDEQQRDVIEPLVEAVHALRAEVARFEALAAAWLEHLAGIYVRSVRALRRAVVNAVLALVFAVLGAITLAVFLVAALNALLGDPWGTGAAAAILFAVSAVLAWRARANVASLRREIRSIPHRPRN